MTPTALNLEKEKHQFQIYGTIILEKCIYKLHINTENYHNLKMENQPYFGGRKLIKFCKINTSEFILLNQKSAYKLHTN